MAKSDITNEARHPGMKLRRERFAREFLVDGNATQAAIRAGYSPRSAVHSAKRLVKRADVQRCIAEASRSAVQRNEITVDRVLQELRRIAFSDGTECFPRIENGKVVPPDVHGLDEDKRRAVAEVAITKQGVRVSRFDKVKALELLGKYLAMFTDRHEVTGEDGGPLVVVQEAPKA